MTESVVTVTMAAGSFLLFAYWFRYTCLLILSAKTTRDYAGEVAAANQLGFLRVQSQLRARSTVDLSRLQDALDRDYALLSYLLANAATLHGESPIEAHMLKVYYRLMSSWSRFSRQFSVEASRRALEEMSLVVSHFANIMGERATAGAA